MQNALLSPEVQAFLAQHQQTDLKKLAFQPNPFPDLPWAEVLEQLEFRQKLPAKIPTWATNAGLLGKKRALEQASSEPTAKFKAGLIGGKCLWDLSGGLGIDTYFFAQKMPTVVHVEPDASLQAIVRYNFAQLGQENVRFVNQTAEALLESPGSSPNWIYLDPSRRPDAHKRAYRLEDCQPNVLALQDQLLGLGSQILLKAAPWLDIQEALQKLKYVWQVWIVALENEVKELLFAFGKGSGDREPMLEAVNLRPEGPEIFSFSRTEEKQHQAETGPPQSFLIEPNRAILKAGAFQTFACRFGLRKLHPHTHLYTTEALPEEPLPGRVFRVLADCAYQKKAVQAFLPEKKASLSTRNFPDTTEKMRQKLGLAEGGQKFVFGYRDHQNRVRVLISEKLVLRHS
ncbi:MAG: hypothetical protein OHK0053_01660 [Microscillaceae bacterium]